jgi:hypothetical protein
MLLQALKILDFDPEPESETFSKSEPETVINKYGSITLDYGSVHSTNVDLFTFGCQVETWSSEEVRINAAACILQVFKLKGEHKCRIFGLFVTIRFILPCLALALSGIFLALRGFLS